MKLNFQRIVTEYGFKEYLIFEGNRELGTIGVYFHKNNDYNIGRWYPEDDLKRSLGMTNEVSFRLKLAETRALITHLRKNKIDFSNIPVNQQQQKVNDIIEYLESQAEARRLWKSRKNPLFHPVDGKGGIWGRMDYEVLYEGHKQGKLIFARRDRKTRIDLWQYCPQMKAKFGLRTKENPLYKMTRMKNFTSFMLRKKLVLDPHGHASAQIQTFTQMAWSDNRNQSMPLYQIWPGE